VLAAVLIRSTPPAGAAPIEVSEEAMYGVDVAQTLIGEVPVVGSFLSLRALEDDAQDEKAFLVRNAAAAKETEASGRTYTYPENTWKRRMLDDWKDLSDDIEGQLVQFLSCGPGPKDNVAKKYRTGCEGPEEPAAPLMPMLA
jgi:hypothetical protein